MNILVKGFFLKPAHLIDFVLRHCHLPVSNNLFGGTKNETYGMVCRLTGVIVGVDCQ